jgi:hypothetical protein
MDTGVFDCLQHRMGDPQGILTEYGAQKLAGLDRYLGTTMPDLLIWDGNQWTLESGVIPEAISVIFAPELNVAGKYIYGASEGGWKPEQIGYYRITFHIPVDSTIDLTDASIGNFPFQETVEVTGDKSETEVARPVILGEDNLTYVDVLVVRGSSKRPK